MSEFKIKNITGNFLQLSDLQLSTTATIGGIEVQGIAAGNTLNVLDLNTLLEVFNSQDLYAAIDTDKAALIMGSTTVAKTDALELLSTGGFADGPLLNFYLNTNNTGYVFRPNTQYGVKYGKLIPTVGGHVATAERGTVAVFGNLINTSNFLQFRCNNLTTGRTLMIGPNNANAQEKSWKASKFDFAWSLQQLSNGKIRLKSAINTDQNKTRDISVHTIIRIQALSNDRVALFINNSRWQETSVTATIPLTLHVAAKDPYTTLPDFDLANDGTGQDAEGDQVTAITQEQFGAPNTGNQEPFVLGRAVELDGLTTHLNFGNDVDFANFLTDNADWDFVVHLPQGWQNKSGDEAVLFAQGETYIALRYDYSRNGVVRYNYGYLMWQVNGSGQKFAGLSGLNVDALPEADSFLHIAYRESSNELSMYVNGNLYETTLASDFAVVTTDTTPALTFGKGVNSANREYLKGQVSMLLLSINDALPASVGADLQQDVNFANHDWASKIKSAWLPGADAYPAIADIKGLIAGNFVNGNTEDYVDI